MTKDEIIKCTDGQALADAVAIEVMGYEKSFHELSFKEGIFDPANHYRTVDWQPHRDTEKGKAQCWDLALMLKMRVNFNTGFVRYYDGSQTKTLTPCDERDSQKRVLKAALLSVRSE